MITIYRSCAAALETVAEPVSGCWFSIVDPTPEEIGQLQRAMGIPQDFVTHPLDLDERARTEKEDGATLIVVRVPYFQGEAADVPYATMPLGIILTDRAVATVSRAETAVVSEVRRLRGLSTGRPNRFLLQLLLVVAQRYLADLRVINKAVDALEDQLQLSLRNREVLGLLKYQKSLVYFATDLKSDELILQHLQRSQLFGQHPDDQDLLDDVVTEIQQALEMTSISGNILSQMMDAFASIISNNLNVVMKLLASVTIIVSIPTLIASLYGMNVGLPLQRHPWIFALIVVVSLAVVSMVTVLFWRRDWL